MNNSVEGPIAIVEPPSEDPRKKKIDFERSKASYMSGSYFKVELFSIQVLYISTEFPFL